MPGSIIAVGLIGAIGIGGRPGAIALIARIVGAAAAVVIVIIVVVRRLVRRSGVLPWIVVGGWSRIVVVPVLLGRLLLRLELGLGLRLGGRVVGIGRVAVDQVAKNVVR